MGSTALEETEEGHEQVHPVASPVAISVAKRSSLSSKCSSGVRISGFSSIRAGARLFSLFMLAFTLTWPYDFKVGAVNFTFNGFKENDIYVVSDSSWIFDSNTSCFYFDPPKADGSNSAAGRFLKWGLVQMRDPVSKKVKSFSTTFIYQIQIPPDNNSTGPGMAFAIVPDNVTVGAPGDYMGLLTATSKKFESDDHIFGVELDTHTNLEFNDPSENHIGINLASMNSTYTCKPDYDLASKSKDVYQQIWIDYFEADSRMDISYAYYGQGKPNAPQGFQRGLDLSFINDNMYMGFSSAKGIESDNLPSICAWSFSNDGLTAPPIVIGRNVLLASPPSSQGLQPPAPAPAPVPPQGLTKTSKVIIGSTAALFILSLSCIILWCTCFRRCHVFRVFISHGEVEDGAKKDFATKLHQSMKSRSRLRSTFRVKTYLAPRKSSLLRYGYVNELATRYDAWVVVISKDYFEREFGMLELVKFIKASKNERGKRIRILPLFYELTPHELRRHLELGTWEDVWQNMESEDFPYGLTVEKIRQAVKELTNLTGVVYSFESRDCDREYIEIVLARISQIYKEWCYPWSLSCVGKRRNGARAEQETGVMTYVQKWLHLLFALSGMLTIFFSVILDNSFNDQPDRFIAFAILAPVMIFLGVLASGWFPRIPLWLIACLKRSGFLKHVSACSPWHDNVVTDFCGKICTLESSEQAEGTAFLELHRPLLRFFHGSSISPQGTTLAPESRDFQGAASTLEPQRECLQQTPTLQPQNEDSSTRSSQDYEDTGMSGIIETPLPTRVRSQASFPNFHETPIIVEVTGNAVPSDHSFKCYEFHEARVPTLTLKGPKINGYFLKVQCFKNTSPGSPTFDLTCTFRNKTTRRMFLTTDRLHNLAQNMCRWVENPHPIVTDKSSDILHSLAIHDILSEFTKGVSSFKTFHVKHRYLAGLWAVSPWIVLAYVAVWSFLSLFPLISNKKSYLFLLSLLVLVPYLFTSKDSNPLYFYNLRELFCPVFISVRTFNRLYLSRSLFIWCNEFRKLRVVNPEYFWIDGEYSNNFLDRKSCFDVCGFVDIPDTPVIESFDMICQGLDDPSDPAKRLKQHNYKLKVTFDSIKSTSYINVTLYFYENNDLLDQKHYSEVEIKRLYLIQQLFHSYTRSCFGGYVERIYRGFWSGTYLAHSPRFLDICHRIINENQVPTLVIARRACSKFIIGVPFSSSNPEI